jgi:hypothetical protein
MRLSSSLSSAETNHRLEMLMTACETLEIKVQRQLKLEQEAVQEGISKYQKMRSRYEKEKRVSQLPPGYRLLSTALDPMSKGVKEFMKSYKIAGYWYTLREMLSGMKPDEVAYITIRTVVDMVCRVQPAQRMAIAVGQAIEDHKEYVKFREAHPGYVFTLQKNMGSMNLDYRPAIPAGAA